ncbi:MULTISPECIES: NAD-dependent epimerase/dehydratase family protein [Pseudomonas fluorescens group]|uniref:NAD-dependent epimerase/dehydratase family protein n=1 Tax=Pseudomonas fluorescens group TaxID=136843 RepID=UPI0008793B90|nr:MULTISPECIES: NAD(P)-dependent oxidoreductase [Pseudomonas fluorescens group]UST60342.1 NAD(P)-dependent oxidoreductase [Pseudomonas moraviensis]UVL47616.1 NAD(P)-dependent oxidoreductase [Pseudomonas moraviensis]SDU53088.1 dTDP-6-deoxy-L-talose 4-dehydrogenase (NAD+) [Pseudomonas moraviensis]
MKVLVTGATGFVGRHLVAALLERGCEIRAVARNAETARSMPWIDDVEFVSADIHAADLNVVALTEGIDALVHLAWPGLPNYRALFHFEHNLMADYRFIKSAVEAGVQQVLVTGTCFEYGMQSGPLSESTEPRPSNPYGLAKHTLHLFLQNLQQERPFTLQWARLFYLHGEGQNPNSLLAALDRAIDSGEPTFNMSAGEQLRDFLAIETAASHLAAILHQRDFAGVVNCASGQPVSVRALVEQRLRERGAALDLNLGHYPYPTHEPMAFWAVVERLQQLLEAQRSN